MKSFTTTSEYPCQQPACFKHKKPDCLATAVIPAISVDSVSGIDSLANCLVHVNSINTTFYIDDKHRPMITWAGPVEIADYDVTANQLNLRSQFCLTENGMVYFDKQGTAHMISEEA